MDKISKKEKKHSTRGYQALSQTHITKITLFPPKIFKGDINLGYQLA